jgi:hypothetical protein
MRQGEFSMPDTAGHAKAHQRPSNERGNGLVSWAVSWARKIDALKVDQE